MTEILEQEENLLAPQREWYVPVSRLRRDSQTNSEYTRKHKPSFAIYCRHRSPKTRIAGRVSHIIWKRRPSPAIPPKVPSLAGGYVPFETVKTFIELLELPHGWNSYNASQIRKENVTTALSILGRIMQPGVPPPIVVPTVRGGVQLEWHTNGINLEIAIDSASDISFFAEDIQSNQVPENLDESALGQWIDRISA